MILRRLKALEERIAQLEATQIRVIAGPGIHLDPHPSGIVVVAVNLEQVRGGLAAPPPPPAENSEKRHK
ncbi:MAG: hypothetical protein DVB22_002595 [Verrucomicrobia bacterium]|nr:MAG: hypothetical protein DVB22_002595 [Verrucomicrobiota bacterium]